MGRHMPVGGACSLPGEVVVLTSARCWCEIGCVSDHGVRVQILASLCHDVAFTVLL